MANITEGQLLGLSESSVAAIGNAKGNRQDVRAAEFLLKHLAAIIKKR